MSKGKWKGKCLWKKLRKSLLSRKSTRKHDDAETSRSTQPSTSTSTTTPSPFVINRPCDCICHCNSCPSSMDSSNPKYAPNAPPLPPPYDPEAPTQPFLPHPQPPYQNNNNTAYGVPVHHHHQYQYQHHNQQQHHQYVNPPPPYIPASPTPEWSTGLCDCCSDVSTCLAGCLCPCFLLGRIAERLDGSSASCIAASLIWYLLQQTTSLGCLYSCGFRRRIRDIYGIRDDALPDCITHFVCWPCAFCQEYRELKIRQEMEDEGWGYGNLFVWMLKSSWHSVFGSIALSHNGKNVVLLMNGGITCTKLKV